MVVWFRRNSLHLKLKLCLMRVKLFFIVSAFIISIVTRAQTSDITEGCAPVVINFTAPIGSTSWFWDFKDGATSNLQNPANTFTTPGTYAVEFRQTPSGPIVGTVTILVFPKPDPQLTSSTATKGCAPLNVTMDVSTTLPGGVNLNTYNWTFGDGNGAAGTPVSHTYSSSGVYSVSIELKTTSPSCDITKIFPDYISCSTPPSTSFSTTPNPPSSCIAPLNVSFTNNSSSLLPLTYNWNMGNGNTDSSQTPAPQTYTTNGIYTVVLIASDTNNCTNTFQQIVSIGQPVSSFFIPDTVCINTTIDTVQNFSTAGTSIWNFGSNVTYVAPYNSLSFEPQIKFTSAGLHSITLTTISGGCSDDTTIFVFVEDPSVTFSSVPLYSCSEPVTVQYNGSSPNNVILWDWSFNSNLQNPTYTYNLPVDSADIELGENSFSTTLTITTSNGCKATYNSSIIIHLPWARFIPNLTSGCAPLLVTFSDSSRSNEAIINWDWDYDDGSSINSLSSGAPHTHTFTSAGEYDVVLIITNNLGCKDTSYAVRIEVGEPVVLDFTVDKVDICPGESVSFTNLTTDSANVDAWHYSSNEELLSHCFTDDNPTFIFDDNTGPQTITLTAEYNGCYSSVTKSNLITVKGPIAGFDYLISCATPYDIQLTDTSQDATSLTWDFGDGTTSTSGGTFNHTYAASGDYTIILTATNNTSGCADSRDTVVAHIRNILARFTTDSLLCQGSSYNYDASTSIDVGPSCYRGYTWIFSDPSIRPNTSSNPTSPITFTSSGPQTIGLVVMDVNGCRDTLIKNIAVYNLIPNYTISDQTICLPDTISFTNMSFSDTTITSWNWSFGDGTPNSSSQNPTHIYNTAIGNTVTTNLVITNALGCTGSISKSINIYSPISNISNVPNICLGQSVTLSASDFTSQGSNLSFNWNFGDGNFGTGNNINYTYASSGSHIATLTFIENATGCTGTTTKTINIQDYPTANYFTDVDSLSVLCNPQQVNFTNSSSSTSSITSAWNWGTGTSASSGLSLVFPKGNHIVTLVVTTSFGCKDTIAKTLNVIGPEGDFTMDLNNICKGESITFTISDTLDVKSYRWDFGDGSSAIDVSPISHTYNFLPPSGQTIAKLTIYGEDNVCPVTIQKTVFIHFVKADFTRNINDSDTVLCLGESLILTNASSPATGNNYSWILGDGGTSNSSTSFNHTYNGTGNFDITLITQNSTYGCKDTITKTIIIVPLPIISALGDSVCNSSTAQLSIENYNSLNGYTYSWTPSAELNNPNIYNPTLIATNSGNYTVTIVDTNNCSNSDAAYLYVVPPLVGFTFDTTIVLGDFVYLPISNQNGLLVFQWSPEEGLSCLDCSNPKIQPLADITYTLFAEDIFGCSSATYYFNIHIRPETLIDLPTTFTPNGDGTNDIIYVKGWGIKKLLGFQIYNRWGELIFETSDLSEGWNGYYKGILQNNDIYVYKVKAIDWLNKELQKEGHINLMR